MLNIAILAFDNCLLSSIAGPLDLFTVANWEKKKRNKTSSEPFCRWEVLTVDGGPVVCFSQEPMVPHRSIRDCRPPDLIILPSVLGNIEALRQEKEAIAWIKAQHKRGAVVASICAGAFLAAERRLSFILLGVAAPDDLIKDQTKTPFNIGVRIDLDELALDDARVLLQGLPDQKETVLTRIFYWTAGHPYQIGRAHV